MHQLGATPLIIGVCSENNVEMCKLLIDNGALLSINIRDNVNNIKIKYNI